MARYTPIADVHAVDEAVIGVRLFEPATDAVFDAAKALAMDLSDRADLPGRVQLDGMSLFVGRQVVSPGYAEITLSPGLLFQRVNADGSMAEELTLERTALTYRTRSYKRWADVQALVRDIVTPLVDTLTENNAGTIAVIELRCIDKFRASNDDFPPLNDIIRDRSGLVPDHLLERANFLHSHSGWFADESEAGRTLCNLNVDVGKDKLDGVVASILQVVSRQSASKGSFFGHDGGVSDLLGKTFDELHASDKKMLAALLTDEMQHAINLAGSSGLGNA